MPESLPLTHRVMHLVTPFPAARVALGIAHALLVSAPLLCVAGGPPQLRRPSKLRQMLAQQHLQPPCLHSMRHALSAL